MTGTDQRFFVFLRAINTGTRRLTNEQLLAPFIAAGCADVAAFQAAGNVVLRTADPDLVDPVSLAVRLTSAFGFDTPAFVRTEGEFRSIVAASPFTDADIERTEGRIQVAFMNEDAPPSALQALEALVPSDDQVVVDGREWFWLPRAGVSTSSLPVGAIERLLGPMTMRTLGTLERMFAKFGD